MSTCRVNAGLSTNTGGPVTWTVSFANAADVPVVVSEIEDSLPSCMAIDDPTAPGSDATTGNSSSLPSNGDVGVVRWIGKALGEGVWSLEVRDIREHLYRHLQSLSLSFYLRHPTGVLMSRVLNDVGLMQSAITDAANLKGLKFRMGGGFAGQHFNQVADPA